MSGVSTSNELPSRVLTYINMVEKALVKAKETFKGGDKEKYVLELAELYLKDSKYYFSINDYITSLSCIAYAEGLLDALRILGNVSFEWVRERPSKVLVGGTFDLVHIGHIHYLREASRYGLVYAVVATDKNVKRIKGREPILPQRHRLELISSIRYVYKAVLGHEEDMVKPIELIRPGIIVLGPDQPMDEAVLERELSKRGLVNVRIIRLPRRFSEDLASTSEIIREVLRRYCPYKLKT